MELELHDRRANPAEAEDDSEDWVRVLEQVMLVMLLVGRWLLPKGKLTREQLSQLLLAYMAMAADAIELFECLKEDVVTKKKELVYATLAIWSWSLLQFTLVLSATHAPKQRPSINYPPPQEIIILDRDLLGDQQGRRGTKTTCTYNMIMYLDMDIVAILTTIFMQDGPFVLLRMTLIFGYNVVSHLNIFFTCKNTLVLSLQLYRLFVLCSRKRVLNKRRKELLSELNSPTEGSEEEEEKEEEAVEENFQVKNTSLLLPPPSPPPPSPPPPSPPPLPPSPPQLLEPPIDDILEESLLEIIEQVGEENIVKELENLVSLNAEKEKQRNSASGPWSARERRLLQMQRTAEFEQSMEDNLFLPDPGFQNTQGFPAFPGRSSKRFLNRVQQESTAQAEDVPSCCEVSDCPSFSDTDQANDKFFDQQGVSASSTSLAEPFSSEPPQSRWPLLREQYLPSHQQSQKKGASVPSGLHGDPRINISHIYANSPFQHHPSFSPEPHRRMKRRLDSRCESGSTRSLHVGQVMPTAWDSPLHRHSSFIHPSRYTGISESDADTMETNV